MLLYQLYACNTIVTQHYSLKKKVYNTSLSSGSDVMNISLVDPVLAANEIRIIPYTWTERTGPCMRVELYGCQYNGQPCDSH